MFKKLFVSGLVAAAVSLAAPAFITASVDPGYTTTPYAGQSVPAQCSGMTFDNYIVQTSNTAITVNGTSSRDLIVATVASDSIHGNAGDDCIVGGNQASVRGDDGNDVLMGGTTAALKGGNGDDTLYSGGANSLHGDAGTDTCVGDVTDSYLSCEL